MTTFTSTARIGRAGSVSSLVLISAMAFALAGCESSSSLLAGNGDAAPQAQLTTPPASAQTAQSSGIAIAPVIGAPDSVSKDLQTQIANAFDRSKIPAVRGSGAKGEYDLRGYIVAAREKAGTKISYIWDVTDRAEKRVHRITGEEMAPVATTADPWSSVNPQIIQAIADKTSAQIATWYNSRNATPVASNAQAAGAQQVATATQAAATGAATAAATQAVTNGSAPAAQTAALTPGAATATTTGSIENGPYDTVVPSVLGAPGDGSVSLTSAIQRELSKNGVPLTTTAGGTSTYKVEGKVAMGQSKDGKQPIQIDWTVFDPKGKKLGTVSQKNEVPQGSLDGTWGKTADAAAQAAAQGIVKLLPQTKTN